MKKSHCRLNCILYFVLWVITGHVRENTTILTPVAAKLVNGPWCKKNRWAPYSHREKFH